MGTSRLVAFFRRTAIVAAVVLGAVVLGGNSAAQACDRPCTYRTITTLVCVQQPYQACVTRYDHCGRPYHAYVTKYRTVRVPVTTRVKVCY